MLNVLQPKFRIREVQNLIGECLENQWTGPGSKSKEFERKWAEYLGVEQVLFLNSATAALHLAFEVLARTNCWPEGSEVVTTPITFVSTNHAIKQAGLEPVFADVSENLCVTLESIRKKITDKTVAVTFVGIGGNIGDYFQILNFCRRNDIKLVLDAAHMAGTKCQGKQVGAEADASVFSMQAVKNIPTADAGLLFMKDKSLLERARRLSWLGISRNTSERSSDSGYSWEYDVRELGYKYNGNDIMASMALVGFKYLEEDNAVRRLLAERYKLNLADSHLNTIDHSNENESSRHLFQIEVSDRKSYIKHLQKHDIACGVHYKDNTEYDCYSYADGTCPIARRLSQRILTLPLHLAMTPDDVDFVCEKLLLWRGNS